MIKIELQTNGAMIDGEFFTPEEISGLKNRKMILSFSLNGKEINLHFGEFWATLEQIDDINMADGKMVICKRCKINPVPYRKLWDLSPKEQHRARLCENCWHEAWQIGSKRNLARCYWGYATPHRWQSGRIDFGRWLKLVFQFSQHRYSYNIGKSSFKLFCLKNGDELRLKWIQEWLPSDTAKYSWWNMPTVEDERHYDVAYYEENLQEETKKLLAQYDLK